MPRARRRCCSTLFAGRDDENRDLALSDDAFGDAAEQESGDGAVAMAADDDDICVMVVCEFHESGDHWGFLHEGSAFDAGLFELIDHFAELIFFLLELVFADIWPRVSIGIKADKLRFGGDDVDQAYFGVEPLGERDSAC